MNDNFIVTIFGVAAGMGVFQFIGLVFFKDFGEEKAATDKASLILTGLPPTLICLFFVIKESIMAGLMFGVISLVLSYFSFICAAYLYTDGKINHD